MPTRGRPAPWLAAVVILIVAGCAGGGPFEGPSTTPAPSVPGETIVVSGSGAATPLVARLAEAFQATDPGIGFRFETGTNSGGAIAGVVSTALDLAVVNRPLTKDEVAQAVEYHPFAVDAVAFVANRAAPPTSLSRADIAAVYGGRITDWAGLGGSAGSIIVLDRDEDESTRKQILMPLMDGEAVIDRTVVLTSAQGMIDGLSNTPDAFGYTSQALLRVIEPTGPAVVGVDGVHPTLDALADGRYDLTLTFAFVVAADASVGERAFIGWVTSPAGTEVLGRYGALPATP